MLQACADDLVDTVLDGCNATILAYGQTGAGKTYTMTGGKADYKQRGLIPRSIHKVQALRTCALARKAKQSKSNISIGTWALLLAQQLPNISLAVNFQASAWSSFYLKGSTMLWSQVFAGLKKKHLQSTCTVRISYLEIYNEQCYDLLDISTQPSDIAVIEDSKDRVIVKGLAAPLVSSEAEALQYLFEVICRPFMGCLLLCWEAAHQLLLLPCTLLGMQHSPADVFSSCLPYKQRGLV